MIWKAIRKVSGIASLYVFVDGGTSGTTIYVYLGVAGLALAAVSRAFDELDYLKARRAARAAS